MLDSQGLQAFTISEEIGTPSDICYVLHVEKHMNAKGSGRNLPRTCTSRMDATSVLLFSHKSTIAKCCKMDKGDFYLLNSFWLFAVFLPAECGAKYPNPNVYLEHSI